MNTSAPIIEETILPDKTNNMEKQKNQEILSEIRGLKKIIQTLEQNALKKQIKIDASLSRENLKIINPECQQLECKIKKVDSNHTKSNDHDLYKQVKNNWKARIISKKSATPNHQQVQQLLDKTQNIEQSIIEKHSFVNSRTDTDQEQPVKTQFSPQTKRTTNEEDIKEFHFKKMDLEPIIQENRNQFRSYMINQRQNLKASRNQKYRSREKTQLAKKNQNIISTSQPDIKKANKYSMTQLSKEQNIIRCLKDLQITKQQSKEELIQNGKKLFRLFQTNCMDQLIFTIKKYRNCIVFSMIPNSTKAIIANYNGDLYYGNASLDETGKIQKCGHGIQIVKERHYYEGHFINGKKYGRGKITYENGDSYLGQWNDGQIYGFGMYIQNKTDRVFEGFWKNGQYCGQKQSKQASFLFQ